MKKTWRSNLLQITVILVVFLVSGFGISLQTADAQTGKKAKYEFRYPSWETPGSWLNENHYFWWPRRVTELSKGEVVFHEFPAATLIQGFDHYESVRDNITPFAPGAVAYEIDTLPLASITNMPNLWSDNNYAMFLKINDEVMKAGLEDYYKQHNIIVLANCPLDRYTYWMSKKNKPVRIFEDAKGKKVRSPGGTVGESISACGSVPVTLATGDVYTSLDRGLIDGIALTATSIISMGILPTLGSWTPQAGGTKPTIMILANYEVFHKLPKHIQDIMVQAGQELEKGWWNKMTKYMTEVAKPECAKNNVEIVDLTPAEEAKFLKAQEIVLANWEKKYAKSPNDLGTKFANILKKYRAMK